MLPVYLKPPSHDKVQTLMHRYDADGSGHLNFEASAAKRLPALRLQACLLPCPCVAPHATACPRSLAVQAVGRHRGRFGSALCYVRVACSVPRLCSMFSVSN